MKVILLKQVPKVGKKDEIVEVSEGYATNALFPRKLAIAATTSAIESLKRTIATKNQEKNIKTKLLDEAIRSLDNKSITYETKANKEGGLFSKIHESDIAKFLEEKHRLSIDQSCLILPDGPIKRVGNYQIIIKDENYIGKINLEVKNLA